MQTSSHALAGAVIGQAALLMTAPEVAALPWYVALGIAWMVCIVGAVSPDLVMVPMFFWDRMRGRQPMTNQGPVIMTLKEMSHSLFVWGMLCVLAMTLAPAGILRELAVLYAAAGLVGGVLPDIPTHSEEKYRETDCTFLWPFGWLCSFFVPGMNALRWSNDRWEYRIGHGVLWPLKPWEARLNVLLLVTLAALAGLMFIR